MTTEHMPTGKKRAALPDSAHFLDKSSWKHHLQITNDIIKKVFSFIKRPALTYMEAGDVLPVQGLVDR